MKNKSRPYRIIGAYDSETTNININGEWKAFPILHQLGILNAPIESVTNKNIKQVCDMHLHRHTVDLYSDLDAIVGSDYGYVPVIVCHNLAFDMYNLASWLNAHDVRVLAKSARKPITFTVMDESGNARLVIWDSLVFSGQSLSKMGDDCGFKKAIGSWDYSKIRTPYTELSDDELMYARHDIYALLCWFSWWIKRNNDISPDRLGINVVTKTGIVRERKRVRFDQIKGKGQKYNIGRYWHFINKQQMPKDDDELSCMIGSTRGGFTFCASEHASIPYDFNDDRVIVGYDATSMHPAQMVSHLYPVGFHRTSCKALETSFKIIRNTSIDKILHRLHKPFNMAFYAHFRFDNIRPKSGSIYARNGIFPLASARFENAEYIGDDQQTGEYQKQNGCKDSAINPRFLFGKLVSADSISVYITELMAYEICLAYDFDSFTALNGYITSRFVKPSDMSVISVMQFYKAKNLFKAAIKEYKKEGCISNQDELERLGISPSTVRAMSNGTADQTDIDACYLSLKADLNALFGIEASNEYRRDTVLTDRGIEFKGDFGICNAPKNPKAWYQFGQRIVGWSRIMQHIAMNLCADHILGIVNGDTDSLKMIVYDDDICKIDEALDMLEQVIDSAKSKVLARFKRAYADYYDPLDGIGYYEREFTVKRFCASWNKSYAIDDGSGIRFVIAGIPARYRLNDLARDMISNGASFADVCNSLLGYNITYSHDILGLNARSFPQWGDVFNEIVTDCNGNAAHVIEPCALALYPMSKTVNDTRIKENHTNMLKALENNADICTDGLLITSRGILEDDALW